MLPAEEVLDTPAQDVPALALGTEQRGRVVSGNPGCIDAGILSPEEAGMGVLEDSGERVTSAKGQAAIQRGAFTAVCSLRARAVFLL